MKKYESVIIITPELVNEKLEKFIEKVNKKLSEYTTITQTSELGLKRLAYAIKGKNEGWYVCHEFEIADRDEEKSETIIKEIEKYFKIQEQILKSIVVGRE